MWKYFTENRTLIHPPNVTNVNVLIYPHNIRCGKLFLVNFLFVRAFYDKIRRKEEKKKRKNKHTLTTSPASSGNEEKLKRKSEKQNLL